MTDFSASDKVYFGSENNKPSNDIPQEPFDSKDFLEWLKGDPCPEDWTSDEAIHHLAGMYSIKGEWAKVVAAMHSLGLKSMVYAVEKAVQQYRAMFQTQPKTAADDSEGLSSQLVRTGCELNRYAFTASLLSER